MVSINPQEPNAQGVKDSRGVSFQRMIAQQKEFINCIYNYGGDGNDSTKIDTKYEKESLAFHLNNFKTWFNDVKEKFSLEEVKELENLISEQEEVLENAIINDDQETSNTSKETPTEIKRSFNDSEWQTPTKGSFDQGTVMRTVKHEDGTSYEEYKNPNTGRTYISYDANGNRTGASWNTVINGIEYPTRKEWTDADGNFQHINIEYDEQGNIVREYKDE